MNNYSNNSNQKDYDSSPETNPESTEIYNVNDREFKIAVIKKLNKLQEKSERQFSELRDRINEQKEYFTKEIKTLKKDKQKFQI